jgi:prophage antirepressor-like protein
VNELQIFENAEFGKVRTVVIDGEPWLVGKDVADILGYSNTRKAIADHVDDEDKGVTKCDTLGGRQDLTVINESGFYSLVMGSKLPTAKRFKRWVTSEVLPSIRKHGAYMTDDAIKKALQEPDFIIKLATELKDEREKRKSAEIDAAQKEQIINELKPKADYTDRILQSKSLVTITQIAKDYGMSGQAMNKLLHQLKVIYKMGHQWLLYSKYQAKGYTHSETVDIKHLDGRPDVIMNTKWTQMGRLFLYELLKQNEVLPVIERNVA